MSKSQKTSHIRSILKGISWRFIATLDTFLVVLLVTCLSGECSADNAVKIGVSEFLIKLLVYYFHERAWLQYLDKQATEKKEIILKSLSWRLVATCLTFVISGIVLKSFDEIALFIALTELFTKLVLYYIHEKTWLKLPLGRIRNFIFDRK